METILIKTCYFFLRKEGDISTTVLTITKDRSEAISFCDSYMYDPVTLIHSNPESSTFSFPFILVDMTSSFLFITLIIT